MLRGFLSVAGKARLSAMEDCKFLPGPGTNTLMTVRYGILRRIPAGKILLEKGGAGWYNGGKGRAWIMYGKDTILVVGQAKPSREDAIYNLHGEFYISLVVLKDTGEILDVECNTILSVTRNFVAAMFIGKSIKTDLDILEKEIRERYFALTQKPLIACMKDAHNRYMMAAGK